jgi:purine-binding chemotaxis protein CheW
MNEQSYLTFKLNHSYYGIPTTTVKEIFLVPEVAVITEAPPGIIGVIDLRGELIPVLDLYQQLGQVRPPFKLADNMIVLEWESQKLGIIVSQVDELQTIGTDQITTRLYGQSEKSLQDGITIGIATLKNGIVTILNPELFIQYATAQNIPSPDVDADKVTDGVLKSPSPVVEQGLYDHLDLQARQVLQDRTAVLRCLIDNQDTTELIPLAVVELGGEYFGLELETVYEFAAIHKIAPIPCCPPHIVGNINLRGEIITLINLNDVVGLPINSMRSHSQAVVVRLEKRVVGIVVDAIFDVAYLHPSQLKLAPASKHSTNDDYFQSVAPYQDWMMTIINLSKLLSSDILVVDEEV